MQFRSASVTLALQKRYLNIKQILLLVADAFIATLIYFSFSFFLGSQLCLQNPLSHFEYGQY